MDETVYQCPECNFNADNISELDSHMIGKKRLNINFSIALNYFF